MNSNKLSKKYLNDPIIAARIKELEKGRNNDYFTLYDYMRFKGITEYDNYLIDALESRAKRYSRLYSKPMIELKFQCSYTINTYHKDVLEKIFKNIKS